MEWYLDAGDQLAIANLRKEVGAYLRRHADEDSDVDSAEVVVSEVLSNVVRHAPGPAWVTLSWPEESPVLEVRDLGPGFDFDLSQVPSVDQTGGRGLFIASAMTKSLQTAVRDGGGGSIVRTVLDVTRPESPSIDPAPSKTGRLPLLDEALPAGGFGRETFLRALVVQLANSIERLAGPSMGEAAVAQVATDVGTQMEAEYRQAKQIVGQMGPEQLSDCFLRLKHAIDGEFFVIEATDERIVLGNRRCPFGDKVQHSPSLCRMTSGVFGSIAAASQGEVSVTLEERIAVGDPECRVVIDLKPPADRGSNISHRYRAHGADE